MRKSSTPTSSVIKSSLDNLLMATFASLSSTSLAHSASSRVPTIPSGRLVNPSLVSVCISSRESSAF
jgi:hypothetical protein